LKPIDDIFSKDAYSFIGAITISALMLFITVCFIMGLLHGVCCRTAFPVHEYSICTKKQGSVWLLLGISISFIFIWLLAAIDIVLVLSGGLMHTEVCRYLVDLQEPSVNSFIQSNYLDNIIDDPDFEFNISRLYNECEKNASLSEAVDLSSMFDILQFTNEAEILKKLKVFDGIDVDLDTTKLQSIATEIDTKIDSLIADSKFSEFENILENVKVNVTIETFLSTWEAFDWENFKKKTATSLALRIKQFLNNFGKCHQLYGGYAKLIDSVCVEFIYTWNSYSLSLGIFIITLTIAMFFGLKLSNLYRKTLPYSKNSYSNTYQNPAFTGEVNGQPERPPPYNGRY